MLVAYTDPLTITKATADQPWSHRRARILSPSLVVQSWRVNAILSNKRLVLCAGFPQGEACGNEEKDREHLEQQSENCEQAERANGREE